MTFLCFVHELILLTGVLEGTGNFKGYIQDFCCIFSCCYKAFAYCKSHATVESICGQQGDEGGGKQLQGSNLPRVQAGCEDTTLGGKVFKQVLRAEVGHCRDSAEARPPRPRTHRKKRRVSASPTPSSRSTGRGDCPPLSAAESRGVRASSTARCARSSASPAQTITSEHVPSASNLRERTVTAISPPVRASLSARSRPTARPPPRVLPAEVLPELLGQRLL